MQKRAVVVLGMHRSGTSALSRALSFYGFKQPLDIMPANNDNPKGFWEPLGVVRLNDRILSTLGGGWMRPGPFLVPSLGPADSRALVFEAVLERWLERAIAALQASYGDSNEIVLKDPRLTVLLPLWRAALAATGYAPRFTLIHRNPLEVYASLQARNKLSPQCALRLWQHHVLDALSVAESDDLAVVDYEDLLAEPEQTIRSVLAGIPRPADGSDETATPMQVREFVSASDRHHSIGQGAVYDSPVVPNLVKDTWFLLCGWNRMTVAERLDATRRLRSAFDDASLLGSSEIWTTREKVASDPEPASSKGVAARPEVSPPRDEAARAEPSPAQPAPTQEPEMPDAKDAPETEATRPLVLHFHLFKNAGTSVDEMLKRNFGENWGTAEFKSMGNRSNVAAVEEHLRGRPELLAFSSHTANLPLPALGDRTILPIIFLRHPIDRLLSAYSFERKQVADTEGAKLAKSTDFAGYVRALLDHKTNRQAQNFQT